MVSTRSKAGANKQVDAGPSRPSGIAPDLAAILDGQVKMQQELADLKKRSAEEMEALKQENSRLRRRIEADANLKGKAKETSEAVKSPAFQPTEEESEYNPTPHTFWWRIILFLFKIIEYGVSWLRKLSEIPTGH